MRTASYYQMLQELLRRPDVACVAIRGDNDHETLRTVCGEQRARAHVTGNPLGVDMPVSILGDDRQLCDALGARVAWYEEGLGWGDLWIEQRNMGESIQQLVNRRGIRRPLFLSHRDEGDLDDYKQTSGDGWHLYEDQSKIRTPETARARAQQEWLERFC